MKKRLHLRKASFRKRAGVSTAIGMIILVLVASFVGATLMLNSGLLGSKDAVISVRVVNSTTPTEPKTPPIGSKNDILRDEPDPHPPRVDVNNGVNQLANFTLTVYDPEGSGSSTPRTGYITYVQGVSVQVEATPDPNWVFNHWLLDDSKEYSNPVMIVMNTTHYLKPVFSAILYNLTISVDGSGSTSPASGIHSYINGTRVFLNATASEGWKFNSWTFDDRPWAGNPLSLIMTRNHELSATFTPIVLLSSPSPSSPQIRLRVSTVGQGTIFKSPDQASYASGSTVQVTATPTFGWQFDHWVLDESVTSNDNPITVNMNGDHALIAVFAEIPLSSPPPSPSPSPPSPPPSQPKTTYYTLTIQTPNGSGSTNPPPDSYSYIQGTQVQLMATPAYGWVFAGWSGYFSGTINPVTLTVNENIAVTATFTQITYTLTVSTVGQGSVSKSPDQTSYASGSRILVTATPSTGWSFVGWNGDSSGSSSPLIVSMTENKAVTATFTQVGGNSTIKQIWKEGNTYYATGGRQSTSFPTLWGLVHSDLVAGDTVHFAGNTEYIADDTLRLYKSDITLTGDLGSDGRPTSIIRAYSSTLPSGVSGHLYLFWCGGKRCTFDGMGFSGLGYTDNQDWKMSYTLVDFEAADNVLFQNCSVMHTQQYMLVFTGCKNITVRYNYIRYGQNGITCSSSANMWNTGVIENNEIRDCSQAGVKLMLANGVIVRNNQIHLEYTYWRDFYHFSTLGPDGLGVESSDPLAHGAEGMYFGNNDAPSVNCEMYGNVITDASVHGTTGTYYNAPRSYGCIVGEDTSSFTTNTANNYFHGNTVDGAYYGIMVQGNINRTPLPLIVYENSNSITRYVSNVVKYTA